MVLGTLPLLGAPVSLRATETYTGRIEPREAQRSLVGLKLKPEVVITVKPTPRARRRPHSLSHSRSLASVHVGFRPEGRAAERRRSARFDRLAGEPRDHGRHAS